MAVVTMFYAPLLREHSGKTGIKGSNPFVSANILKPARSGA